MTIVSRAAALVAFATALGAGPVSAPASEPPVVTITGKSVVLKPFALRWEESERSTLNLSFLLHKPAGRDGFIANQGGHFTLPSGERFRIWGVNLVFGACFPDKADAPKVAAYLARFGLNAVRLHFLDSSWGRERSLLANGHDHTRSLAPVQLDNLDYFIAELKKAGVYTNFNLNVGRIFREGDEVPEHRLLYLAKGATLFDDRLIELQKEFARQLLTHVNPYTGRAYKDEPAVAVVEIVNENSLVAAWVSGRLLGRTSSPPKSIWSDIPPSYGRKLTEKYNSWLRQNLGPADLLALAAEAGVQPGAPIPRLAPAEFKAASEFRFATEARFIMHTERQFYLGMYRYLKDELGVKSLITANSDDDHSRNSYAFLSSAAPLDYVDGHAYWHYYGKLVDPATGKERWGRRDNVPMVTVPAISNPAKLSRSAVAGLPYTVSETNHGSYNDYHCEGVPLTGAYAALQDWDGIFHFALAHVEPNVWNTFRPGGLDVVVDPVRMANLAASGLMYLRGDLQPAPTTVLRGYSERDMIAGLRAPAGERPFFTPGFSPLTALVHRTRIASFERPAGGFPPAPDPRDIRAETGEIRWCADDVRSRVEIASPRSEALVGFFSSAGDRLRHLHPRVVNEFGALTLVSLDGQPIATASRLLLVATARAGLTGTRWSNDGQTVVARGERPTTIEVISGEVELRGLGGAQAVVLEPLDGAGNSLGRRVCPVEHGRARLPLGSDVTVWYLLTR